MSKSLTFQGLFLGVYSALDIDLSSIDVTRLSSNFFLANSINLFISSVLGILDLERV